MASTSTKAQSKATEANRFFTVRPVLDANAGKYNFIDEASGQPIEFAYLPLSLDVRRGDRDPGYLIRYNSDPKDDATTNGKLYAPSEPGDRVVRINMPLVVMPSGWLATDEGRKALDVDVKAENYANKSVLVQGNTRIMGVERLMQENLATLQAAKATNDPKAVEGLKLINILPFPVMELTKEEASDRDYIQWLQISVNDGVKSHSPIQLAQQALDYRDFLVNQRGMKLEQATQKTASLFGFSVQRIKQFITARNQFPEWLWDRIEKGVISFDTAVLLRSRHANAVNGVKIGKQTVKLETELTTSPAFYPIAQFFNDCLENAIRRTGSEVAAPMIAPQDVNQVLESKLNSLRTEEEIEGEGEGLEGEGLEGGGTGEGGEGGEGSTGGGVTPDPYADKTPDEVRELINASLPTLIKRLSMIRGQLQDWTPESLVKIGKAIDQVIKQTEPLNEEDPDKTPKIVTVAQAELIQQRKEEKSKAKKADATIATNTAKISPEEAKVPVEA